MFLFAWILAPAARPADAPGAVSGHCDLTGSVPLMAALRSHILQSCRFPAQGVDIRSASSVSGVVLPEGDLEFRVLPKNPPANYHRVVLGIEAVSGGNPVRSFWVLVDASIRGRFVRAKRRIPFGAVLSPADVELVEAEVPDVRSDYFALEEHAIGKIARRVLMPGDAVSRDMVSDPFIVRAGEMVRLRVDRGGVSLSAAVRAEQNGRLGQMVRVRNLEFERALKARVVGPGEVRVD